MVILFNYKKKLFFFFVLVDVVIGLIFVLWGIEFKVVYIIDYLFISVGCFWDYYMLCDFISFYVFGIVKVLVVNGNLLV